MTRVPVVRMQLVAAAASLFAESMERPEDTPRLERVARLVDEALATLDLHGVDVREESPDWQAAF